MGWFSDAWDRLVDGLAKLHPANLVENAAEYNENLLRQRAENAERAKRMRAEALAAELQRTAEIRRQQAAERAARQAERDRAAEAAREEDLAASSKWHEDMRRRRWESQRAAGQDVGPYVSREEQYQRAREAYYREQQEERQARTTGDLRHVTAQGYHPVNTPRTGPATPARSSSARSPDTGRTSSPRRNGPAVGPGKDVDPGLG